MRNFRILLIGVEDQQINELNDEEIIIINNILDASPLYDFDIIFINSNTLKIEGDLKELRSEFNYFFSTGGVIVIYPKPFSTREFFPVNLPKFKVLEDKVGKVIKPNESHKFSSIFEEFEFVWTWHSTDSFYNDEILAWNNAGLIISYKKRRGKNSKILVFPQLKNEKRDINKFIRNLIDKIKKYYLKRRRKKTIELAENLRLALDIPQEYFEKGTSNLISAKWNYTEQKVDTIIQNSTLFLIKKFNDAKNQCITMISNIERRLANLPISKALKEIEEEYSELYDEINEKLLIPLEINADLYEILKPFEIRGEELTEYEWQLLHNLFYSAFEHPDHDLRVAINDYKNIHESLLEKLIKLQEKDIKKTQPTKYPVNYKINTKINQNHFPFPIKIKSYLQNIYYYIKKDEYFKLLNVLINLPTEDQKRILTILVLNKESHTSYDLELVGERFNIYLDKNKDRSHLKDKKLHLDYYFTQKENIEVKNNVLAYIQARCKENEITLELDKISLKIKEQDILQLIDTEYDSTTDSIKSQLNKLGFKTKIDKISVKNIEEWFKVISFIGNALHKSFDVPNYFRFHASKWKDEVKDFHPWLLEKLIEKFGQNAVSAPGVSGGHVDFRVFNIPIEAKLYKKSNIKNINHVKNDIWKFQNQLIREAGHVGLGVSVVVDVRNSIINNEIQATHLGECVDIKEFNNTFIIIFIFQAFLGTPSKI